MNGVLLPVHYLLMYLLVLCIELLYLLLQYLLLCLQLLCLQLLPALLLPSLLLRLLLRRWRCLLCRGPLLYCWLLLWRLLRPTCRCPPLHPRWQRQHGKLLCASSCRTGPCCTLLLLQLVVAVLPLLHNRPHTVWPLRKLRQAQQLQHMCYTVQIDNIQVPPVRGHACNLNPEEKQRLFQLRHHL